MRHERIDMPGAPASAAQGYGASRREIDARVRRFLPLVRRTAWHIHGGAGRSGTELEDLMQIGVLALTECAQRHAGPGEDGFAAYAKLRVRGAMIDHLRRHAHESRTARARRRECEAAAAGLRAELGREPGRAELAARLGCDDAELLAIEAAGVTLAPLDDAYDETNLAFASEEPDPFEALCTAQDRDRLAAAVGELPERLQLVLQLFFAEELNLTEIAAVLEVSVPRVHQLRAQALAQLRGMLSR